MSTKAIVMLGATVGSTLGGFLPALWGGNAFSGWAVLFSVIGGFAGIWAGWKMANG